MILERKCFVCGGFGHIACNYRNGWNFEKNRRAEIGGPECQSSSNKFEVLTSRMIQVRICNKRKKEKLLREVIVKIGLK